MSNEELEAKIDAAVEEAIFGVGDLDEIEAILNDAKARIDNVRAYRGEL